MHALADTDALLPLARLLKKTVYVQIFTPREVKTRTCLCMASLPFYKYWSAPMRA